MLHFNYISSIDTSQCGVMLGKSLLYITSDISIPLFLANGLMDPANFDLNPSSSLGKSFLTNGSEKLGMIKQTDVHPITLEK